MQITDEIKSLFKQVRSVLGAPILEVQLEDNQLCDLLSICIGDYSEKVQNWIIQFNWLNMYGKNKVLQNPQELMFSFTTRMLDFTRDYSYWFSRDVGLQQRGNFELKKDFITIEKGKQNYLIPAGREINKVLYVTPSTTKAALYGNMGMLDTGVAGGYGQYGNMGNGMGITGFYVGSAYDTALLASDIKYKNSLLRGDLCYKVTAGPEGTHILHLLSTPGSRNVPTSLAADDSWGWNKYVNCVVWYTYYDVSGASQDDIDACRLENRDDILLTPDQVPVKSMRYELMNEPTQQTIRQLLTAQAMITLGFIRGTYSGTVLIPDAQLQMDYSMFLEEGKALRDRVFTDLKERLEQMLPWNMMSNIKTYSENAIEVLKHKPLPFYVI